MSATPEEGPQSMDTVASSPAESEITAGWAAAHIFPLWENRAAHQPPKPPERPYHWPWDIVSACIRQAIGIRDLAAVERRVLMLVSPHSPAVGGAAGTTTNLNANIQILMPGETARPHRHSMNALRFVMEGDGAMTIVDGRECAMAEGDLVTTPGWCWHEHVHRGDKPVVWLDVLDASLHRYLGTARFQPGPPNDIPARLPDASFATAGLLPQGGEAPTSFSPLFRYPWDSARKALDATPVGFDGTRRIRYANPVDGGPCMAFLDCYLVEIEAGQSSLPFRTSAHAICTVVEGTGESRVGDDTIVWKPKDVFSLPHGNWIRHTSTGGAARLFIVTDREIYRRLDLLTEEYASQEQNP
jgi:gentisate 1,2-dioxygenase